MNLDLKPMLRGEVTRIAVDFAVCPEPPYGVTFGDDAHITGEITNQGGYMHLTADVRIPYSGTCARCLDTVENVFTMPFERTVVTEGTLTEEQEEDNIDEYVILENGMLNIDDAVCEAVVLSFPMRLLCAEDCPGLCPKCGKSLKNGPCGCPQKETDPRWDVLKSIRFDEGSDRETEGDGQ